ncbi:hypothetical protein AXG93_2886s1000 [Marchantia polymorpha subsp. ruderalis]|uniref:Uncharacterized protein n=1 Tax=Marchantia polymorpha subsp. ruderalis TaxID=1480154 RepID=A0A176WMR8_MARPO|nr:hypothetical protein AXG93_2886s1000 [Marchantia polymorpha subsp. ruderalis]
MGKGTTRGRRTGIAVSSKDERECERVEATDLADRVYANQRYGTDQEEREGPLVNHLNLFLVHFYRGMDLLTREKLRRFPREREIITAESSEGTEDDTHQPSIPPQTTARGPVHVDVVRRREKLERRLAKRRKVVSDEECDLVLEVRRTKTEVGVNRQKRTRARPKQRANRGLVAAEESDSSVEKTVAPIMYEPEAAVGEQRQPVEVGRSSEVLIEVLADMPTEPLKEGVEIISPNSLSSERTRSARSEETPQPKRDEELVKELTVSTKLCSHVFLTFEVRLWELEPPPGLQPLKGGKVWLTLTLSEEILEQVVTQVGGTVIESPDVTLPPTPVEDVRPEDEKKTLVEEVKALEVTFPDFLQYSVVSLLQYLDRKREKYAISKEVGFYVELIRNRTQLKRAVAMKREWDSASKLARERAANLEAECAAVKVTLQEREAQLREKEVECEKVTVDLIMRLEKSREAYEEPVKRSERLIVTAEKREKKYIEDLAKVEARRAKEVRIAEELRGKIAEAKTAEEDLRRKISEIAGKCDLEFRRAEELSASLAEGIQKHEGELEGWVKKLADCESARSSEVECRLRVESECRRLREQLGKADMRSQKSHWMMEKAEEAYGQLRDETTDELKLRLEKCLNGFAM